MKTFILTLLTIILLISCATKAEKEWYKKEETQAKTPYGGWIQVITVDSCEYIVIERNQRASMVHKQNCKNHKY